MPIILSTTYTWIGTTGAWATAANWTPNTPSTFPNGTSSDALIDNGGTAQVSAGTEETVAVLTIGDARTANNGAVLIADNAELVVTDIIRNAGQLAISNAGNVSQLYLGAGTIGGTVTLSGGGALLMGGSSANDFIQGVTGWTLDNVDNTISGQGTIGNGEIGIENDGSGVIDATATTALTIHAAGSTTNAGLIEATGSGRLILSTTNIVQTGGTVQASGAAALVQLSNGATIVGGTIGTQGGGSIATQAGNIAGLTNVTLTAGSTYTASDNSATEITGTLTNLGVVALASIGNEADLRVADGASLTGGGTISMVGNESTNRIFGLTNSGTETLTNVNNTILGAGSIGASNLIEFINRSAGTINATSNTNALVITPTTQTVVATPNGGGFVNQGLLESTAAAGLVLNGGQFNNQGGLIRASGTSIISSSSTVANGVYLESNVTISGGTLSSLNGGILKTAGGQTANLDATTANGMTLIGTYVATDNSVTTINGDFVNTGTIQMASVGNVVELLLGGNSTLTGGGVITMSDQSGNDVFGLTNSGSEIVTNVNNTIVGSGSLGVSNSIGFVNQASGVVDAAGIAHALIITPTGASSVVTALGGGFVNQGLLEATTAAGLVLNSGRFDNLGGTILASGAGDDVYLQSGVTVAGGVLKSTGGANVGVGAGQAATLDGSSQGAMTLVGTYLARDNTATDLSGVIDNTGQIQESATADITDLKFANGSTLTGGGTIVMTDQTGNRIWGVNNTGSEVVTNVNNTIQGSGSLGVSNSIAFINEASGLIDATGTAHALIVTPGAVVGTNGGGFVNQGLLEATAAGGLVLNGGQFNNLGGTIVASGAGDDVYLQAGVIVSGGLLESTGGAVVSTVGGNTTTLDGTSQGALKLAGTFVAHDNTTTSLNGTINNTGTFQLASIGDTTDLKFANGSTLIGGGTIVMSDLTSNRIWGVNNSGSEVVTNVNNTIKGSGSLGVSNSIAFINEAGGVIDATGTASSLVVTPGAVVGTNGGGFVNQGLLEATAAAGLVLTGGQFNNLSGTILASGTGDDVYLQANVIVSGGLLESTGGAVVSTVGGNTTTLDGTSQGALKLAGTFVAHDNTTTNLNGTINNTGTFQLASIGNTTDLKFANGTTLTGGGTLTISDNNANRIWGQTNSGTEILTNLNNTIQGSGQFGVSAGFGLNNSGTVSANQSVALTMLMSTSSTIVANGSNYAAGLVNEASGVLQAAGGSLLITSGAVENLGTEQALNASALSYGASVTNLNVSSGTLTAGTWAAIATGGGATLTAAGGAITTNAATITLSGTGATVQFSTLFGNEAVQSSLTSNTAAGALNVLNNQSFTGGLAFSNAGLVALGGGTFSEASFANSGTLDGFGTVTDSGGSALNNSGGAAIASGGTLIFAQGVGGTGGAETIDTGAAMKVEGAVTGSQTFTVDASAALELTSSAVAQTQVVLPGAGSRLTLDAPAQFAGTIGLGGGRGGTIDLAGVTGITPAFNAGSSTWTLSFTGGSITVDNVHSNSSVSMAPDSGTGTLITFAAVCFVAGTRIATPDGEVPIETLRAGDPVLTVEGGAIVPRAVRWVGYRRLHPARHPRPETATPIRVRAGALGPDQPRRDLLVSPEHCLFLDGGLVPVRRLVNGTTIAPDRTARTVVYYHIELDKHAVLLAEGAAAESYLDTGNRAFFENAGLAMLLHPEFAIDRHARAWSRDACAPLIVADDAVRAIWDRLAARATALGWRPAEPSTTTDPALCLVVDGRRLPPVSWNGRAAAFVVPSRARSARLVSRAEQPGVSRPWVDDDRRLGVAVSEIAQRWRAGTAVIAADDPALIDGWHAADRDGRGAIWRWTDGDAAIPLAAADVPLVVTIAICGVMTYRLADAVVDVGPERRAARG